MVIGLNYQTYVDYNPHSFLWKKLTNVSQNIKQGIEGHAVDWYDDVFKLVFPNVDAQAVNNLWKEQLKKTDDKKKDDHDDDD